MNLAGLFLCAATLAPGQAQEPRPALPQEYYQSLKGTPEDGQVFRLLGPDAQHYVKFEPEGLRITLPLGWGGERPSTGLVAGLAVKGDFEITIGFEILKEPEPADAGESGTRLSLGVFQDTPKPNVATISRSTVAKTGRKVFVAWTSLWND
jgi:hypothetical protein